MLVSLILILHYIWFDDEHRMYQVSHSKCLHLDMYTVIVYEMCWKDSVWKMGVFIIMGYFCLKIFRLWNKCLSPIFLSWIYLFFSNWIFWCCCLDSLGWFQHETDWKYVHLILVPYFLYFLFVLFICLFIYVCIYILFLLSPIPSTVMVFFTVLLVTFCT